MKKCYNFFLLILLSVLFTSCDEILQKKFRNTPYTTEQYDVEGAKSIIYKTYSYKSNKSELISTEMFDFDNYGRLVTYSVISDNDTLKKTMLYAKDGRIYDIKLSYQDTLFRYTSVYDKYGDLIKEYYNDVNIEYKYDEFGNITLQEGRNIFTNDYFSFENKYENGILKEIDGLGVDYSCNTDGLIVSKSDYIYEEKCSIKSFFTYKFDNNGNWIVRVEKNSDGKVLETILREIVYYPEEELMDINAYVYKDFTRIKFLDNYINDVLSRNVGENRKSTPTATLFTIVLSCTVIIIIIALWKFSKFLFHDFFGKIQSNGMKRLWMYNIQPYEKVGAIILIALAAFILSVILLFTVGGFVWGILWIVRILLFILTVVGVICAVVGGISLIFGAFEIGCLPLIIGIPLCIFAEDIQDAGENLVDWGFEFMKDLNLFNWGINLFVDYWDTILIVFCIPMLVFLGFALLVILLNLILNGLEYVITRIYSVRRPCPVCNSTDTPEYIIGGKVHPVKLHPGVYGIFSQTSPVTGQRVPTMLLNGRGKVTRKCKKCNSLINAETDNTFGTEIHIGVVGHRSSGKSYLLYSGLSSLMEAYKDRISQIDTIEDTNIEDKIRRIQANADIQTDVASRYRATQLMLKSKLRPIPYHLFFYDVAGEKFDISSSSYKTAMDFYRSVQTIVFVVDPSMIDISGTHVSPSFANWYGRNAGNEKYKIEGSFAVLKSILETVGRKSDKIDFNFVCTKADMGYLTDLGYMKNPTEEELERFMSTELGLSNLINSSRASFKSVHFYAVSVKDSDKSKLRSLFETLLLQRKVSF